MMWMMTMMMMMSRRHVSAYYSATKRVPLTKSIRIWLFTLPNEFSRKRSEIFTTKGQIGARRHQRVRFAVTFQVRRAIALVTCVQASIKAAASCQTATTTCLVRSTEHERYRTTCLIAGVVDWSQDARCGAIRVLMASVLFKGNGPISPLQNRKPSIDC